MNENQLERAERELLDYDRRIREAEDQQALLTLQRNATPPSLVGAAGTSHDGPRAVDCATRGSPAALHGRAS